MSWLLFHLLLTVVGFAVGCYGTMIGAGGGFVLVPVLLVLYPNESPAQLTAVSLAAVFFNATSGSVAYLRARRVDVRTAALFSIATLPGAVGGALVVGTLSRGAFDVLFGVLVTLVSLVLLLNPTGKVGFSRLLPITERRRLTDADGETYEYGYNLPLGLGASVIVGFLSSLFGIGGGIIHVPVMSQLLGFPAHIATATSHAVLAVMTGAGTITHLLQGSFSGTLFRVPFLAAGIIPGAQLGARVSARLSGSLILRLLAVALLLVGLRLLATPLGVL